MNESTALTTHADMNGRKLKWKNIGYALANLLLWVSARFLYARLGGRDSGFLQYDVLFIVLPPIGAFFANWYWLRDRHTDMLVKWAVAWAAVDLVIFAAIIISTGSPLHQFLLQFKTVT